MPTPSASETFGELMPPAAAVARFRRDLGRLVDLDSDRVVVGVSGGADSLALLLLAHAVLGERCVAATVDHRLRRDSAAEARWVADLCARRGIDHATLTGDLPARVDRTANLSARARKLRYDLLWDHAAGPPNAWVATAHHADDQVETFVMRANRGAGVAGLSGIRERSRQAMMIVRPLLGWRRVELEAIVADCGIEAIQDPSNVDDRFDRARLRKALRGADWLDAAAVGRSAAALASANDALDWSARALWRERRAVVPGGVTIDVTGLPDEYRRRLTAFGLEALIGDRAVSGPSVERLLATLDRHRPATLADVLVTPRRDRRDRTIWTFTLAPPRRTG